MSGTKSFYVQLPSKNNRRSTKGSKFEFPHDSVLFKQNFLFEFMLQLELQNEENK